MEVRTITEPEVCGSDLDLKHFWWCLGSSYKKGIDMHVAWTASTNCRVWSGALPPSLAYFATEYHCMADLLFDLFRFGCFANAELTTDSIVWFNRNQSSRRSAVQWLQWYFPLWSKWVFSATIGTVTTYVPKRPGTWLLFLSEAFFGGTPTRRPSKLPLWRSRPSWSTCAGTSCAGQRSEEENNQFSTDLP